MTEEITKALIFDTGSGYFKGGFAENDIPTLCIPTICGTTADKKIFGNDALNYSEDIELTQPISRGKVTDWDKLEHFWHHCYLNEFKADSVNHPLISALAPTCSKYTKEKLTQIFFETFSTPGIYLSNSPLLSLYGSGKTNGLIVDSGSEVTSVTPIIDGYCIQYAQISANLGGNDITNGLKQVIKGANGEELDFYVVDELKLARAFVSTDYKNDMAKYEDGTKPKMEYELPDGSTIELGKEIMEIPEKIFNPESHEIGLVDQIYETLNKVETF